MKNSFIPEPSVQIISSNGITVNKSSNGQETQVFGREKEQVTDPLSIAPGSGKGTLGNLSLYPARVSQILRELHTCPETIDNKELAADFQLLLQVIEGLSAENEQLKAENQKLRDALNLLKGEQGQPEFKKTKKKRQDVSSEQERKSRRSPKEKKSKAKKEKIKIDRVVICPVNQGILPKDVKFKGYQSVVVQEIIIKTDNVEYKKEVYYSPSQQKTYMGSLPEGVEGEFGPGVKSLVHTQKHVSNMSEPKIEEFLENVGTYISSATISRILTQNNEQFHQEKADIFQAGLAATYYQQIDDTGTRVKGEKQYVQIVCNPYYTAYFTTPRKDRLSVLDVLQGKQDRNYHFNEEAFDLLATFRVSQKNQKKLRLLTVGQTLNEDQMNAVLEQLLPNPEKGKNTRTRIREAGAITAYHQQTDFPVIPVLLSDDAPQFKHLTQEQALCWIHDGRHYKKLTPVVPLHQEKLDAFQKEYWDYYQKLLDYKENPSQEQADTLSTEFDTLFSTETHYPALDKRIAKTKDKKEALLLVLKHPELPLHNNAAELGARVQARKRDVSLHTMSAEGTQAQDTFLTIVQTAKQLDVSAYAYIHDRVSKRFQLPSLAELIQAKSSQPPEVDDTS